MLLTTLSTLVLLQDPTAGFSGRANQITVPIPRIETAVEVDGNLDEPVWRQAARLTDFSQFQPVDGRPAAEPTEVMVWYAPDAIFFGIRAREIHGEVVRATRANRDNITSEDHIQILLDTNNDHRLAFLFGVNPLGVQQDGTRSDQFGGGAGGFSATGGGTSDINPLAGNVDLNPDYVFQSRGRLVDGGYEVEIRIPFKSLRYQDGEVQDWGLNVLRQVQHSGFQDTWTPTIRANASFLAQSGTLTGLQDLHRGLVLEVTPTTTALFDGSRGSDEAWNYDGLAQFGADVRWGIKQNLTLNGTFNPDFSQVEADVGQVLLNERFALFFPEKRPFFLEGLELFDSPNQLIYTRRIISPTGGTKLGGKVGRFNVGAMVVLEDPIHSWSGEDNATPVFGIARLRRDLGESSTIGAVLTTREDDGHYSRLVSTDLRVYHSKLYWFELQAAQSWSDSGGPSRSGPLFGAAWDRTGRQWGFHYNLLAIAPDFRADAGFVNRTGVINLRAFNRLSFYGAEDALVQTVGGFAGAERILDYSHPGDGAIEGSESIRPSATLRGGWQVGGALVRRFFRFDEALYRGYTIQTGTGTQVDTAAFIVPGPASDQWVGSLRVTTPTFRHFTATVSLDWGRTPLFREATAGRSKAISASIDLRPTGALRAAMQVSRLTLHRRRDDSRFSSETIPRLKVEYQVARSLFLRFVGQYAARARKPLLDASGNPILVDGVVDQGSTSNEFRMDWLFSYRPIPGTLVYLGYGSTLEEPDNFSFRNMRRTADGFFGKISYVFRL